MNWWSIRPSYVTQLSQDGLIVNFIGQLHEFVLNHQLGPELRPIMVLRGNEDVAESSRAIWMADYWPKDRVGFYLRLGIIFMLIALPIGLSIVITWPTSLVPFEGLLSHDVFQVLCFVSKKIRILSCLWHVSCKSMSTFVNGEFKN